VPFLHVLLTVKLIDPMPRRVAPTGAACPACARPTMLLWAYQRCNREPGMVHDEPGILVTWNWQDEGMAATSTDCD
jgi:hypothetical protein